MKPAVLTLSSLAVLAASALAFPAAAQSVEIKGAVARVVVIPEDRADVDVEIVAGTADLPRLKLERNGEDVVIDGSLGRGINGLRNRVQIQQCRHGAADARQPGEGGSVSLAGRGRINLEEAPLIVLRTPRDVSVAASGAVYGSVGPSPSSLSLSSAGCGQWTVANVEGGAKVNIGGSGRVRMGTVGHLAANIGGSGDLTARSAKGLDANIGGSGDIKLDEVDGRIGVRIGGSGDVQINSGSSPAMSVSIAGSGDVAFDGRVDQLSAAIVGSGDVRVREVTGPINRSVVGSGKVRIGD